MEAPDSKKRFCHFKDKESVTIQSIRSKNIFYSDAQTGRKGWYVLIIK
jgi:hypothetical protein